MTTSTSSRIEELYQNRSRRAEELKKQGEKVIGYFCCYPPLELMTALDLVPYRIMGSVREPITQADAYIETIMCPFVRSSFDLSLKGRYDFLDGIVWPHSCDTIERIGDIWTYHNKPQYSHFLNVPHMIQPSSREFFKDRLIQFKQSLEEFTGKTVSPERLSKEVKLHNELRSLLRELYSLRKSDPPLISGADITQLMTVVTALPPEEAITLLKSIISEVKTAAAGPSKTATRLLLYGCEIGDPDFPALVEESGANVVIDDHGMGTRTFWDDVPLTSDPLDGITRRYLELRCPRTYRPKTGTHAEDLEARFAYLTNFVREFNVNGAILFVTRYCDTTELDSTDVREHLQNLGIPVLHLEDDYTIGSTGQLKTRVQAFLETIE